MNVDTDNFEVGFNIPALVGMNELDIQTPCLVLDLAALERNIIKMGDLQFFIFLFFKVLKKISKKIL